MTPKRPALSQSERQALDEITEFYLASRDFNGLPIRGGELDQTYERTLERLLAKGRIQIVSEKDYPNPHIRPWPSRRTKVAQLEDLRDTVDNTNAAVCVYPTPEALEGTLDPGLHSDAPYRRRMAEGKGTLELAFFSFDVLEPYRNDPRYHFDYWDFGVHFGIADDPYLDESEPERDKTSMQAAGFAYSFPTTDDGPIYRRICAFYCDLADLTPAHQRRWSSYELEEAEADRLHPHPQWWNAQMGRWPDGIGPFEKLFGEIEAIAELSQSAIGESLFRNTERPQGFGWVLRPTQREWDDFVMSLDKILAENLRHEALDLLGAPREEEGRTLGTLARLERGIAAQTAASREAVHGALSPFRDVRAARQKPAHALRQNVTDRTLVRRQRDLLQDVIGSLTGLRHFWMRHPKNSSWKPKEWLDEKYYRL